MSDTATTIPALPYVGVTGYASIAQANDVYNAVRDSIDGRVLMDGYLLRPHDASDRWTPNDGRFAKYAARFIGGDAAEAAFNAPRTGSLRIVHFCTNIPTALDQQLQDCVDRFGLGIDGFQINWLSQPNPTEMADLKRSVDGKRIEMGLAPLIMVLQLHPDVLAATKNDVPQLLRYVSSYVDEGAITHVLYDPSGGQGVEFDSQSAIEVTRAMRNEFPEIHLGVAGGLSPENVREKVEPVWMVDPLISIDIEGRVRDDEDRLDLDRTIAYLRAALSLSRELGNQRSL